MSIIEVDAHVCSIANVQVNELTLGNMLAYSAASAAEEIMALMLLHMNLLDCKAAPVAWDVQLFHNSGGYLLAMQALIVTHNQCVACCCAANMLSWLSCLSLLNAMPAGIAFSWADVSRVRIGRLFMLAAGAAISINALSSGDDTLAEKLMAVADFLFAMQGGLASVFPVAAKTRYGITYDRYIYQPYTHLTPERPQKQ
jgi:hypothetical protein